MRIKTADLIGPALDWAVAKCEGYVCQFDDEVSGPWLVPQEEFLHDEKPLSKFSPSTNWSQGGPIIERERITISQGRDLIASIWHPLSGVESDWYRFKQTGLTPLVAAMRCYVASRLGDEVDVPEELL